MARPGSASPALLAAVALGAAALHQLYWLLPLALMLGLPALWFGHPLLAALAGVTFLVLAWVFQPRQAAPPQVLAVHEAPRLYERVHAIADALQAPRVHAIALDDELNAGALELNRGVSLRPVRRVLVLGRPLLAALDTAAVEAVIAHELGHFSRQHGRLGHWLYRTRQSWVALKGQDDAALADQDSSAWDRAASGFACRFLPWFDRLSLAHMRHCEFEADAIAAREVGAQALARALSQLERLHSGMWLAGARVRRQLMLHHAEPPQDLLAREVAAWRDAADASPQPAGGPDDEDDTHPRLVERLAALGSVAVDATWPGTSAGATWWSAEGWVAVVGGYRDDADPAYWRMAHRLLQRLAPAPDATPERRWQLALARGEPEPDVAAGNTPAALLLGARAALRRGDRDTALRLALACREQKTAERDEATSLLVKHGLGTDVTERRRHADWWRAVQRRRAAAFEQLDAERAQGRIGPPPLDAAEQQALRAALCEEPAILEVEILGQDAQVQSVAYQAVVVLLRIQADADEDAVGAAAHGLLGWVGAPALLRAVQVRYAGESLTPALAQALAAAREPGTRG